MPLATVNQTLPVVPAAVPRASLSPVVHDDASPQQPGAAPDAATGWAPATARIATPIRTKLDLRGIFTERNLLSRWRHVDMLPREPESLNGHVAAQPEAERGVQPDRIGVARGRVHERRLAARPDSRGDREHEPGAQTLAAILRIGAH